MPKTTNDMTDSHCVSCRYFDLHTPVGTVLDVMGGTAADNIGVCRYGAPETTRKTPYDTRAAWPQVEGAPQASSGYSVAAEAPRRQIVRKDSGNRTGRRKLAVYQV